MGPEGRYCRPDAEEGDPYKCPDNKGCIFYADDKEKTECSEELYKFGPCFCEGSRKIPCVLKSGNPFECSDAEQNNWGPFPLGKLYCKKADSNEECEEKDLTKKNCTEEELKTNTCVPTVDKCRCKPHADMYLNDRGRRKLKDEEIKEIDQWSQLVDWNEINWLSGGHITEMVTYSSMFLIIPIIFSALMIITYSMLFRDGDSSYEERVKEKIWSILRFIIG